jgi:glutathione S-transferase
MDGDLWFLAMSIILYHADECPYCVRTRLVLAAKSIDHDTVDVDLSDRPPILRELNPRNRVPVLVHDGLAVSESEAINEYLDEIRPDPPLMPADAAGRAAVRMMMRRFEDLSDAYYAARRGETDAFEDLEAALLSLDLRLREQPYIAGDIETLAEPGYWPWVVRLHRVGVDPRGYPGIAAWLDRLETSPEYAGELALLV